MKQKTEAEWASIIQAQEQSGLKASVFCREHQLDPAYFSQRKKRYLQQQSSSLPLFSPFVVAKVSHTTMATIKLHWQSVNLELPVQISPLWLADVMRGLAHEVG